MLQDAEKELKSVRQLLRQCKDSFDSLVKFFGENPQALANDSVFWADVISFVNRFTACQREVFKQAQVETKHMCVLAQVACSGLPFPPAQVKKQQGLVLAQVALVCLAFLSLSSISSACVQHLFGAIHFATIGHSVVKSNLEGKASFA